MVPKTLQLWVKKNREAPDARLRPGFQFIHTPIEENLTQSKPSCRLAATRLVLSRLSIGSIFSYVSWCAIGHI